MRALYDATDEMPDVDPFVSVSDVVGLYHPDAAAAASATTACDQGSGPMRIDD